MNDPLALAWHTACKYVPPQERADMAHDILVQHYRAKKPRTFQHLAIDILRTRSQRGAFQETQHLPLIHNLLATDDFTARLIPALDIVKALRMLSQRDYQLLVRTYYYGDSAQEIAQAMGYTVPTVYVLLTQARSRLAVSLRDDYRAPQ